MAFVHTVADGLGLSFLQDMFEMFMDAIWCLKKVILHAVTGKPELARICGDNKMHSAAMTIECARSIKRSKRMPDITDTIFHPRPFPVDQFCMQILAAKKIPSANSLLTANLNNCLLHMNLLNATIEKVKELQHQSFSDSNVEHVKLLEELWTNLRPNVTRKGGRITEEWGDLGFQGKDPSTDFRGAGMLGLMQLVFLSKTQPSLAIKLLQESQVDHQYFPFSAVSINVTVFAVELLLETRFNELIYREMDKIMLDDTTELSNKSNFSDATLNATMCVFHKMYCALFFRLGRKWLQSDSVDLMAFPKVMQDFKSEARFLYPKL